MKKVFAQTEITNPALGEQLKKYFQESNPGETFLGKFISNILSLFLIIAALIFFFMLVIGGVQWMLSGGDKNALQTARERIASALIGLLIVFASWSIVLLLEKFLGITILGEPIVLPSL